MKRFERFAYDQNNRDDILYLLARAPTTVSDQSNVWNRLFFDHIFLAESDHFAETMFAA